MANETSVFVPNTLKSKKSSRYFLLLIPPIVWFRCFSLVFCRTQARTRSAAFIQYFIFICVVILMFSSCYLFYAVTADSGEYNLYLTNVASRNLSMSEGRDKFNDLIWRSVLKTFFLGIIFGLIQACNFYLAAQWRQRLCDRFQQLLFQSSNGYILYETSQSDDDISKVLTNDIKQFTSNFATVLFGSMFFAGTISVFLVIILACVFLILAADGDATGVIICFTAFIICVLIIIPTSQLYNRNLIRESKSKGQLRGYLQRIQTNAECIVLYGSQRVELKYIERMITNICNSMLISSISFALVNFPIQLLNALNGMCTYIMPTIVFFFIRNIQTPVLAQTYLVTVPLYSFLITILGQLLLILEPCLITVTMGDHLWKILNRLEKLEKQYRQRITYEQEQDIRRVDMDSFVLDHLNISIPNIGLLLQNNVNIEANRGQNVLIRGPSGCGKTTLFRICAGFQSIDAKHITLPHRQHLLFIPQRPYLPIGNLRFQALFLLNEQTNVNTINLNELFRIVNLEYLLERYSLDTSVDWSTVLSVGEQQRLAFIRLFAYFILTSNKNKTLVFFDESTSAVDVKTEQQIYNHLIKLGIWFVTISHRSSLIHLHHKSLEFSLQTNQRQSIEIDENENNQNEPMNVIKNTQVIMKKDTEEQSISTWQQIVKIFKFVHVPFEFDDKKLKIQTILAWIFTLSILSISTWCSFHFTKRTANLYNILSDYSSNLISIDQAKQSIKSDIVNYIVLMIVTPTLYSLASGCGQLIATFYTRRQMIYVAKFLLDGNENNLLYHSRQIKQIPNCISHDITQLNSQIFYLIIGHIYYTGVIGQITLAIVLSVLLGKQNGGSIGVLVVYLFVLGFFFITNILSAFFNKWIRFDEMKFTEFITAHKRVDLQAEQIAFSGERAYQIEKNELHQKLDISIRSQIKSGFFYSIIVGFVRLSIVNTYLVNYGIPAAIFFHSWYDQGLVDSTKASQFITLSVFMYNLFSSWNYINYFVEPLTQIQSIGIRIINYLDRLEKTRREGEQNRRVFTELYSNEQSLVMKHIDVRIPGCSHILISDINLSLSSNENLFINGPSGCGKSSLIRLLAGLISNESVNNNSQLHILSRRNTIFLSQQLHLIEGTLREQLSYLREARGLGLVTNDIRARELLNELNLGYLIDRYSMDSQRQNWSQLLSIGEQQRLILVTAFLVGTDVLRLLVLDETTSACDQQTEDDIYEYLRRSNIQFLSVSHRKQLAKYHSRQFIIDNNRHTYSIY